jgi:hypothetical protein
VKAHEDSRLQCSSMVLNDVVDQRTFGEPLSSVLAGRDPKTEPKEQTKKPMINLNEIKITPRDQQRAGCEELPAHRLRQAGSVDPAGTRALCGRPRRGERAYASGLWAVAPGGRVERGPGTSIFGQRSNQRNALRKRRAVVREAGMHRWSDGRLARPAGLGGRAFHRQFFLHHWIFPYAMIPVPNHSRQPTTHSTIRPKWRIPHRRWSSTSHRWQTGSRKF